MGFVEGRRRIDVCSICCAWDKLAAPAARRALEQADRLVELLPTYFQTWAPAAAWAGPDFQRHSSAKYLAALAEHVGLQPGDRGGLSEVALAQLQAQEMQVYTSLLEREKEVDGFGAHFFIRDAQSKAYAADAASTAEGHIWIHWDFEESGGTKVGWRRRGDGDAVL